MVFIALQAAKLTFLGANRSSGSAGQNDQVSAAVGLSPTAMQCDFVWKGDAERKLGGSVGGLVGSRPVKMWHAPFTMPRNHGAVSKFGSPCRPQSVMSQKVLAAPMVGIRVTTL